MPPKKKKKGGKKKGKKKAQNEDEKLEMIKKTKEFLKLYTTTCAKDESPTGIHVIKSLKQCIEDEKPLIKIILDPQRGGPARAVSSSNASVSTRSSGRKTPKKGGTSTASSAMTVSDATSAMSVTSTGPPVQLKPLIQCLTELKYMYIRCLHLWYLSLTEEDLVSLALFIATRVGKEVRVLDLTGTNPTSWGLQRLSRQFETCQLVHLTLDYNRITPETIGVLCHYLRNCLSLISLNLNYCHLTAACGEPLGLLTSATQLRYLGLQGNNLQAIGLQRFIGCLTTVMVDGKGLPSGMPLLERLFLQDNAIDGCGSGDLGVYAPVTCMQIMGRWLTSAKNIQEIRLEGNLIGDSAARELLLSLQQRKEIGLPSVKISLTNKVSSDTFGGIMALSGASGKKKKKGKGKKKKK